MLRRIHPPLSPHLSVKTRRALSLGLALLLISALSACGGASSKTKRRLGMKSHYVSLATLGEAYKAFRQSELDPFDASPKVKRRRGSATILIKYHSYKLSELDAMLAEGASLYGAYRFAEFVSERFDRALIKALGADWEQMNAAELAAELSVLRERKPSRYRALRDAHSATLLSVRLDQSLVGSARALYEEVSGSQRGALEQLKRSPKRSLLLGDVAQDLKRLSVWLKKIQSGAPALAKRLGARKGVITALSAVF